MTQQTVKGSTFLTTRDRIFIPFHVPSSKNSRMRTKSGLFIASKATRNWRKDTASYWEQYRPVFLKLVKDKPHPLKIGFHFIRKTSHKYDWVNPLQTIQDEMVKYGWIPDDSINYLVPFPLKYKGKYTTIDNVNHGVLIKIY